MSFKPTSSILTEHSAEMQLVLAVAALRPTMTADHRQRVLDLLQQGIDWDKFMDFVTAFDVLTLIAYNLNQYFRSEIPPETQKRMEKIIGAEAFRRMTGLQALTTILREFEQHNIAVLGFKGPSLMARCYDNIMQRHFADLDFIIHPAQFELAVERLGALGYQLVTENTDSFWNKNAFDTRKGYHQAFSNPNSAFKVEIHWRITNKNYSMALPEALMWANVQSVYWAKVEVKTFADELLLMLLNAHAAKHKWTSLKWVVDMGFLMQDPRDMDWAKYLDLARRFQCVRRSLVGVVLAAKLFDLPLPPVIQEAVRRDPEVNRLRDLICLWLLAEEDDTFITEQLRFMADVYESPWLRLQQRLDILPIMAGRLMQPSERDRALIKLPQALSFMYILIRPFRYALERVGLVSRHRISS